MKTCGSGGITPPFFTSALDVGEWPAWRSSRFNPGEIAPGNHWIGGCVGTGVGLEVVEKKKVWPCRKSNTGRPARRYTDWAIPTPTYLIVLSKNKDNSLMVGLHAESPTWCWCQCSSLGR
jgi:hypothetical protein